MPEMRCMVCKNWLEVSEDQVNMPTHYVKKRGVETRCPGSRRAPLEKR